eukprot:gene8243-biopygen13654
MPPPSLLSYPAKCVKPCRTSAAGRCQPSSGNSRRSAPAPEEQQREEEAGASPRWGLNTFSKHGWGTTGSFIGARGPELGVRGSGFGGRGPKFGSRAPEFGRGGVRMACPKFAQLQAAQLDLSSSCRVHAPGSGRLVQSLSIFLVLGLVQSLCIYFALSHFPWPCRVRPTCPVHFSLGLENGIFPRTVRQRRRRRRIWPGHPLTSEHNLPGRRIVLRGKGDGEEVIGPPPLRRLVSSSNKAAHSTQSSHQVSSRSPRSGVYGVGGGGGLCWVNVNPPAALIPAPHQALALMCLTPRRASPRALPRARARARARPAEAQGPCGMWAAARDRPQSPGKMYREPGPAGRCWRAGPGQARLWKDPGPVFPKEGLGHTHPATKGSAPEPHSRDLWSLGGAAGGRERVLAGTGQLWCGAPDVCQHFFFGKIAFRPFLKWEPPGGSGIPVASQEPPGNPDAPGRLPDNREPPKASGMNKNLETPTMVDIAGAGPRPALHKPQSDWCPRNHAPGDPGVPRAEGGPAAPPRLQRFQACDGSSLAVAPAHVSSAQQCRETGVGVALYLEQA